MTATPRTTLWRGGRVRTPADPFATALLTDGDTVAFVGSDAAGEALGAEVTIDLHDALVTPAFVDAHVHATATGLALTGLDLTDAVSLADALDRLERYARTTRGAPVLGTGWDETRWPERRPPTRQEVDRASYGSLVYLARTDVHSAVVSSALLVGAPRARELPGFDDSGHVRVEAHHALRRAAYASVTPAQRTAAQRATRAEAARLGIGSLHEMAGPEVSSEEDLVALLALAAREPGPDVLAYWGALEDVDTPARLGLAGAGGDLFCDGALGSHTAALTSPYVDKDTVGVLRYDAADVARHVAACTRAGLQAGFHAIGDAALEAVVAGIERVAADLGLAAVRAGRHRIEHAELLDDGLVTRAAALGLVASVQPAFDERWGGGAGMYVERLGADRAARMNPYAALATAGVPLALGSDAPVTPMDPWGGVRAAVQHRTPGYGLSARAAFAAATRGGWRAARVDGVGDLVPGAPATFALWDVPGELVVQAADDRVAGWSTDPRSAVPGLPDLSPGVPLPSCRRTVVRGRTVFDALA